MDNTIYIRVPQFNKGYCLCAEGDSEFIAMFRLWGLKRLPKTLYPFLQSNCWNYICFEFNVKIDNETSDRILEVGQQAVDYALLLDDSLQLDIR